MRIQRISSGQRIAIDTDAPLGAGGEARVYAVLADSALVAKMYHQPTDEQARKLRVMLANPPEDPMAAQGHTSIAWPVDMIRLADRQQPFVGFLMPRVSGTRPVFSVYNPSMRRDLLPLFHYRYLHRTARNIAAAVRALHARGYVIGDVNESNILVSETALVTLVDTDSFQVRDPVDGSLFRCAVGKPEFTPPELQKRAFSDVDRRPEHDLFGLAVLFFQLLMEGTHPFGGLYQGVGDPPPYDARIAAGHYPYGARRTPYLPVPSAPPIEILNPTLRQLFVRCFEDGFVNPRARPDAQTWQTALAEAEADLMTCARNSQHRYGSHLAACPWCERAARLGGRDPFPKEAPPPRERARRPVKTAEAPVSRTSSSTTLVTPRSGRGATSAGGVAPAHGSGGGWPAQIAYSGPSPLGARTASGPVVNGWAAAGVICVLLGLLLPAVRLPLLGIVAGALAAVCGGIGLSDSQQMNGTGRWPSIASGGAGVALALGIAAALAVGSVQTTGVRTLVGGSGAATSLAFSPDGGLVAGASDRSEADRDPGVVSIWDTHTARLRETLAGFRADVTAVAFSPDGRTIASGSGGALEAGELRLWDTQDGLLRRTLLTCRGYVNAAAFSPDGQILASGGTDRIVRLWSMRDGGLLRSVAVAGEIYSLAFSPDSGLLACGSGVAGRRLEPGRITVWNARTGALAWKETGHSSGVLAVAFSPNRRWLATAGRDNSVRIWQAQDGKLLHEMGTTDAWTGGVAFSPDSASVASGGSEGVLTLWNSVTGAPEKSLPGSGAGILALAFAPDGKSVATGGQDGAVRLWRVK